MIFSKFLIRFFYSLCNNTLNETFYKTDLNDIILPFLVFVFVLLFIISNQLKKTSRERI